MTQVKIFSLCVVELKTVCEKPWPSITESLLQARHGQLEITSSRRSEERIQNHIIGKVVTAHIVSLESSL